MARNGVVIAQQGINVGRASDYQKVLDSRWKFMDIFEEVDIDISFPAWSGDTGIVTQKIYSHPIGKLCAFEFWPSSESILPQFVNTFPYNSLMADETGVFFQTIRQDLDRAFRIKGKLRQFTLEILEDYAAPTEPIGAQSISVKNKNGAQFLDKSNYNTRIGDSGLTGYTMNTAGKQLSIHKHGLAKANVTLTITHNVGYPPSFLLCRADVLEPAFFPSVLDNRRVLRPLRSNVFMGKSNESTITFRGVQSSLADIEYGYVILKDPAELAQ